MGAVTYGEGDDSETNSCGIYKSHAFSIFAAFTMKDSSGEQIDALLVRNPWGLTSYNGTYNSTDPAWTDSLVQ